MRRICVSNRPTAHKPPIGTTRFSPRTLPRKGEFIQVGSGAGSTAEVVAVVHLSNMTVLALDCPVTLVDKDYLEGNDHE